MEKIIKMCDTPFYIQCRKKDYSDAIESESKVDVNSLLGLVSSLQPAKPLKTTQEQRLKADII